MEAWITGCCVQLAQNVPTVFFKKLQQNVLGSFNFFVRGIPKDLKARLKRRHLQYSDIHSETGILKKKIFFEKKILQNFYKTFLQNFFYSMMTLKNYKNCFSRFFRD